MPENILYYGDNLEVLRLHVRDESVDLVYLDPPFNSNATYNVLFAEHDGSRAASQIKAFEDTWHWDQAAAAAYQETVEGGGRISEVMQAFRTMVGDSDMLAYLAMMAPRLIELRRILKSSGSLYLHCDQTASHYLKLLLDAVFGPACFRNEIVWRRTASHNDARRNYGIVSDYIFYYVRGEGATFNQQYRPHSEKYLADKYHYTDQRGRRYRLDNLRSPHPRPNLTYDYKGFKPHPNGWAVSLERMKQLDAEGRLEFPRKPEGRIQLRRFLDEMAGMPLSNVWEDIPPINSQAAERLGYPTQKPVALLERILNVSTNAGDLVLDPFCGCGTTIDAAQKLGRTWIGIDITALAITLIKSRLQDTFGSAVTYKVIGEPVSIADAEELARSDPYQFQWWALGLVGARPAEQKKGADKGIDGRLYFHDEAPDGKTKQIILSVKAGHVTASQVRDLVGVVHRERATIGGLISFKEPTAPMRKEAASAGYYVSSWGRHPCIQLLTVSELLDGKRIDYPPTAGVNVTYKKAPKALKVAERPRELFDSEQ